MWAGVVTAGACGAFVWEAEMPHGARVRRPTMVCVMDYVWVVDCECRRQWVTVADSPAAVV